MFGTFGEILFTFLYVVTIISTYGSLALFLIILYLWMRKARKKRKDKLYAIPIDQLDPPNNP
jgi:hypothetical protein